MNAVVDNNRLGLSSEIDRLLEAMSAVQPDSNEYPKMVAQLVKLYDLKTVDNKADETAARVKEIETKEREAEARIAEIDYRRNETNAKIVEIHHREKLTDAQVLDAEARLEKTRLEIAELDKPWRPNRDQLIAIGGNIVAIGMIIGYERANVITSKALGFIGRALR